MMFLSLLFLRLSKDFRRASRVLTEDQIEVIKIVKISGINTQSFPAGRFCGVRHKQRWQALLP